MSSTKNKNMPLKQIILKWRDVDVTIQEFIQEKINSGWFVQSVIPESFYDGRLCMASIVFFRNDNKHLLREASEWWSKLNPSEKYFYFENWGQNGLLAADATENEILDCYDFNN